MAYSEEQIESVFLNICYQIEDGRALRQILKDEGMPSSVTFFKWLEADKEKAKRYARATELRADAIFEDILDISDHTEEDHTPFTGSNVIQRDRLKIDARKWILSKMHPKKYGDKLDLTSDGDKISEPKKLIIKIPKRDKDADS